MRGRCRNIWSWWRGSKRSAPGRSRPSTSGSATGWTSCCAGRDRPAAAGAGGRDLADRSDIAEELVRLKTHAAHLESMLEGEGEIGKRLDFLLQEMNRESNTVLSKTGGSATWG